MTPDPVELLAHTELFGGVDRVSLSTIADQGRTVALRRNDLLFEEGDEASELFVVRRGRLAIAKRSFGRESVMSLMEAGDLFGEFPLFDGQGRSADARALVGSDLLAVPYDAVHAVLHGRVDLLWAVCGFLARRLRSTDAALADSMFLDVTGRTAKRLLELAGDNDEFVLPVTQEELAGMVGASRERVNKAIAAFVKLGWMKQVDRRYSFTDREQLTRRSR